MENEVKENLDGEVVTKNVNNSKIIKGTILGIVVLTLAGLTIKFKGKIGEGLKKVFKKGDIQKPEDSILFDDITEEK